MRVFLIFAILAIHFTWQSVPALGSIIGVFVYRHPVNDHIHITLSDEKFNETKQLNIWNKSTFEWTHLNRELEQSRKHLFFKHSMSRKAILKEWSNFYIKIKRKRSILKYNCAFASRFVLQDILGLESKNKAFNARIVFGLHLPSSSLLLPIPDQIFKNLRNNLESNSEDFIFGTYKNRLTVDSLKIHNFESLKFTRDAELLPTDTTYSFTD